MLYRYLAKKQPFATPLASATWQFPMRQFRADHNGNSLFIAGTGFNSPVYDYLGYFNIAPDGSAIEYKSAATVRTYRNNSPLGFQPGPVCYLKATSETTATVWMVSAQTTGISHNSDGRFVFTANASTGQVVETSSGGSSNNGPNYLSTLTKVDTQNQQIYTMRRVLTNGSPTTGEHLTTVVNRPPQNEVYAATPIVAMQRLSADHLLIGYTSGGQVLWDVHTGTTTSMVREHINVPIISNVVPVKTEMRGNVLCAYGGGKAWCAVWNGGGSFTPINEVTVPTTGAVWPVNLPDGRIFVANASANSRCLTFSPTTGFSVAANQFNSPAMLYAGLHTSGRLIAVTGNGTTVSMMDVPV